MVVCPSFSAEYSVLLVRDKTDPLDESSVNIPTLKCVFADKSIWYSMPENNSEKEQKEVHVTTQTVKLPKPLASRLLKIWGRMLAGTRYPPGFNFGFDGTTYEFAIPGKYGETWSPQEQTSPFLFAELGKSLVELCKSSPENRDSATKEVEMKASQLEAYLDRSAGPPVKKFAEQPGTGQPATRPVDKPEGSDKPQPEAEGRSR